MLWGCGQQHASCLTSHYAESVMIRRDIAHQCLIQRLGIIGSLVWFNGIQPSIRLQLGGFKTFRGAPGLLW